MQDVVWLARYTASGLNGVLDMDTDTFFLCFDAALKVFEQEINTPTIVLIKGYIDPE